MEFFNIFYKTEYLDNVLFYTLNNHLKQRTNYIMNIQGSKILITGGSLGLGKAMAKTFTDKGAKVIITGRNMERLQEAANETGASPIYFDISKLESIPAKAEEIVKNLGGIDVLINNAGIGEFALLQDLNPASFERVFHTNVFGLAMLTKEISKHFIAQSKGNIINIGSTAASKGFEHGTVYAASKFAVRGMTQCWQAELRKHNIRVTLLNPSEVTTAFAKNDDRTERPNDVKKLEPNDIAQMALNILEMDDKGFIPEVTAWATNPW